MTQVQTEMAAAGQLLGLRVGETVEVRSAAEIRATLDDRGELENLPFMPEMAAFCGQQLTVHKVAHKLCDTISRSGMRRMTNAVFLTGARCDGSAHGGCETACSLLWREQWLKRVSPEDRDRPLSAAPSGESEPGRALLPLLVVNARKEPGPDGEERHSCQATELLRAAPTRMPFHDVGQYVEDVRSGNVGVFWMLRAFLIGLFNRLQSLSSKVLPEPIRFRHGLRWGFLQGRIQGRTPNVELNLSPGELIRVRSKEEIMATVNADLLNRGMGFDEEMSRYCGQTFRVKARVQRCIDEPTGRMLTMKYPCIILENNICAGAFNLSCPREYLPFWREIWLERVAG